MVLQAVVQQYVDSILNKRERKAVASLLLSRLPNYLEEEGLSMNISMDSLRDSGDDRKNLEGAFYYLYSGETRSKNKARLRILAFTNYLEEKYNIRFLFDDTFTDENLNSYERQVDLLKSLQEGMTTQELKGLYDVTWQIVRKDIDELIKGTEILGQHVKIRDYQNIEKELTYQSTIHPIFLPLNLTEVYYLLRGLKLLAKRDKDLAGSTIYENLANRMYTQLSDYGRKKIDKKAEQEGYRFPLKKDFGMYNGSIDEEDMARESIQGTLDYLYKLPHAVCTVHLNNESMDVLTDYFIEWDRDDHKKLKLCKNGMSSMKISKDDILTIEFKYR
ncbi:MAG: hypothetical protein PHG58_04445 [Clostridia bacterium]|nr:hypothetical protein [Clostridia bacterium]